MGERKTKLTLIGTTLAEGGREFIYEGEAHECRSCKIKKACINLQRGKRYTIVSVRPSHHECPLHLKGVQLVEVKASPITLLMRSDLAIERSHIRIPPLCQRSECQNYPLCHPEGILTDEKYLISTVYSSRSQTLCDKGAALVRVEIIPLPLA